MCDVVREIYRLCREQAEIQSALRTLFQQQCYAAGAPGIDHAHTQLMRIRRMIKQRGDTVALRIFDQLYDEYYATREQARLTEDPLGLQRPHPYQEGDYEAEEMDILLPLPRLNLPEVCQH